MAKVWTYGGHLEHASRATSSKQGKAGEVNTNQKFYETNSRIVQLNKELRKTLEAMARLCTHYNYYVSMVREKNKKQRLANIANGWGTENSDEAKKASSMSKDEIKRYGELKFDKGHTKRAESGPINSIAKIVDTMRSEYDSAYKKYQTIATLSSKLSSMEPVSKTAAAFSYEIMRDIYELVYKTVDQGITEVYAEQPLSESVESFRKTGRDWLANMPKPTPL